MARISTLTPGYQAGDLSLYPLAFDTTDSLYQVTNGATTNLSQSLPYNATQIVVNDASLFPASGLLRVGPLVGKAEQIYYGARTATTFTNLQRGFAGTIQSNFSLGTLVTSGVMAEIHNASKDALLNMESNLGTQNQPSSTSLNGILQELESTFLAPKPVFRAFPFSGAPPLRVRFQNFSGGPVIRVLWDFGDGSTSSEFSPIHTYTEEGIYSVQLNVLTSLGAQGIGTKSNYITVSSEYGIAFFYSDRLTGVSIDTANAMDTTATTFTFVDQSEGQITQRIWDFNDGNQTTVTDPDIHTITHQYQSAGSYQPTLVIVFTDQTLKRVQLADTITTS